ncbi:cysteine desulfurase [Candidatus Nitrosoglobus terrae]|uniref:cysteine desulfurase n=1 Tax=Candidatus Nitrosoglobus terrae TaxID=1630141 RepID=A0A1Q2SMK1_9GAMM|nr:cysteine desulfurase family protein [Candidatus Nitrosoglobus terrae]BAW80375.1 cysteine desulfurase [Candidatus Nitrosoglobus terrae]
MAIYFDHNAGSPLDKRVLEAMLPYLQEQQGNPSSVHRYGRIAKEAIEQARIQVATLIHADPAQVIFTSGGTEANNLALFGVMGSHPNGRLAISAIEHSSIQEPAFALRTRGVEVTEIKVDFHGKITISNLERALYPNNQLVSVMWASNETGVLQEIFAISEYARSRGSLFHTDAVQAIGKVPIDFHRSGAHLMSISAHKMGGPKGVGALVVDSHLDIVPLLLGGGQEKGLRSGTENVAAIVGFGKAAELASVEIDQRRKEWFQLREHFERSLQLQLPEAVIFGSGTERLPNTVFFAVPKIEGETLLMALDKAGIGVSSGSACGSGNHQPSHVLLAMGITPELAQGAIRVSIGVGNTLSQVDELLVVLKNQIERFQQILLRSAAW